MTPSAILLLNSQGHAASLATSAGPWALTGDLAGFACVLLATALIVTAVERLRRR